MKSIVILAVFGLLMISSGKMKAENFSSFGNGGFVENKGQIADDKGNARPDVLYKSVAGDVTMFFRSDGIVYLFNKYETVPTDASKREYQNRNYTMAKVLETRPMIFRMDLKFLNTNPGLAVIPSEEKQETSNYYLVNCPEGITGVSHYEKITYKNIYNNIDIVYYFTAKGLKYDVIVHPGGNISDVKFVYEGANNTNINSGGQLEINYADGQNLTEEAPVIFYENGGNEDITVSFSLDNVTGIAGYVSDREVFENTLTIDPSVVWATYFYGTASSNSSYTNPEYDSNGNLFLAVQTYDNTFPTVNPGGGAYYDATKSTMMEVAVLKFNSSRTLVWST